MNRLMGLAACANQWMRHIRINVIRLNVLYLVFVPLVCLFIWALAATTASTVAWAALGVLLSVYGLSLASHMRHDIIFQTISWSYSVSSDLRRDSEHMPDLAVSARFKLCNEDRPRAARILDMLMSGSSGDEWFFNVPAVLESHPQQSNYFSFVSHLDPSRRFLGIRLEDKRGRWIVDGRFDTLERPEWGLLYFGLKTLHALRLRFQSPRGKRRMAVITFRNEGDRELFLAHFAIAAKKHSLVV